MRESTSDSERFDMGDEEFALKETVRQPPPPLILPAVSKIPIHEVGTTPSKKNAVRNQFSFWHFFISLVVILFLLGLIELVHRGVPVMYSVAIFALAVVLTWFGVGWREAAKLRKRSSDSKFARSDDFDITPDFGSSSKSRSYSLVDLILLLSIFVFFVSICTLLPGSNKMGYAVGFSGFCSLIGLIWLIVNKEQHPLFVMTWWLMLLIYLATSLYLFFSSARGFPSE